ncbi:MAG: HEAT repeat domain-containing protein, partial [Planctomycetota bacterium]|nr:HEAT repeat domain-containing protein [Planctomycetota bacterium]
MKFSQPLVLLLGGLLSASGIGCSAINAVVSDSRPAHRENRSDTDRIAAIGRVFENQGRYDKAEVMYRKALKGRPQDTELRSRLQQLAARGKNQSFGPTGTAQAIASADRVSPPKADVRQNDATAMTATDSSKRLLPASVFEGTAATDYKSLPELEIQKPDATTAAFSTFFKASHPSVLPATIAQTSGKPAGWHSSQGVSTSGDELITGYDVITCDDVMAALEDPERHVDLLLDALESGDSTETKALAATLLGDCDPENMNVRDALVQYQNPQTDPDVLIAVWDSQIERGEANGRTVSGLLGICAEGSSDARIQAASQLRHFVGTEFESSCLTVLNDMLDSAEPNIRASAAITLGDFASMNDETIQQLRELARADTNPGVREAAESTLNR